MSATTVHQQLHREGYDSRVAVHKALFSQVKLNLIHVVLNHNSRYLKAYRAVLDSLQYYIYKERPSITKMELRGAETTGTGPQGCGEKSDQSYYILHKGLCGVH